MRRLMIPLLMGIFAVPVHAQDIPTILSQIRADSIDASVRTLANFHTRHTLSDTLSDTRGIGAARRWIYRTLNRYSTQSGGRLQVSYHRFTQAPGRRIPQATEIVNVVAVLPGSSPTSKDRILVVSGHYDSICGNQSDAECHAPGANDDASGTAAVMELARVMSQYQFDATIVFMAVAGEEQGLYGAYGWAEQAVRDSLDIQAMFTNDIIGSPVAADGSKEPFRVRLFADGIPPLRENSVMVQAYLRTGGENDLPSRQLARHIVEVNETFFPAMKVDMIYRRDRYLRGGDHIAFLEKGYAAVRFSEPNENYAHQHQNVRVEDGIQYGDLPEFVDAEYVARVARVNAVALAATANAPASPSNVRMDLRGLTTSTTLRWAPNTEPDLAGYRIVWRETTSPVWQHRTDVGNVTEATLPYSKDNVIFGVQALNTRGFVSPAVYPLP
jgi:hypothetical protein